MICNYVYDSVYIVLNILERDMERIHVAIFKPEL